MEDSTGTDQKTQINRERPIRATSGVFLTGARHIGEESYTNVETGGGHKGEYSNKDDGTEEGEKGEEHRDRKKIKK